MKVAIVAPQVSAIREPQGGGSQALVSDLARGLAGRGHEVHVYAATGSEIPGVAVIATGVDPGSLLATLYRAGSSAARDQDAAASAFAGVYARVRETRYDVVHNHAFDAPAIGPGHRGGAPRRREGGVERAGEVGGGWDSAPGRRRRIRLPGQGLGEVRS